MFMLWYFGRIRDVFIINVIYNNIIRKNAEKPTYSKQNNENNHKLCRDTIALKNNFIVELETSHNVNRNFDKLEQFIYYDAKSANKWRQQGQCSMTLLDVFSPRKPDLIFKSVK